MQQLMQIQYTNSTVTVYILKCMLKYTYYYRVRARRQKEIEKQPIKIEKISMETHDYL